MNWVINSLFWSYRPAIGFVTLAGLFIFLSLKKRFPRINALKKIIVIIGIIIVFFSLLFSLLNAYFWKHNFLGEKLLPPYTSLKYIFRYSFVYYWWKDIIAFVAAGIIFWLMRILNKKFHSRFFYEEEPYLAVIGILLTGWPNCLIFLCLVLFLGILFHLFIISMIPFKDLLVKASDVVFRSHPQPSGHGVVGDDERGEDISKRARWASARAEKNISRAYTRLSLLYFWLPGALLVLVLSVIINQWPVLHQLTF